MQSDIGLSPDVIIDLSRVSSHGDQTGVQYSNTREEVCRTLRRLTNLYHDYHSINTTRNSIRNTARTE